MPDTPTKYSLDISQTLVFCLVFVAMSVLVALGKLEPEKLQYLLLVLIPSPVKRDPVQ